MFEPSPVLLAFVFVKRFVFLELLALLALARVIAGGPHARRPALVALLLSLAGLAVIFAPAAGMNDGIIYASGARLMAHGGGMTALLPASALMLVSAVVTDCRGRWIDVLHVALLAGLLGLWVASLL
ncbi:hypothetical protein KUH32_13075 [Thalassococcus sp. CAU 1522]|uniref:Uncharacterized protein n=1 Tax=Thalassococcus arenae TaxID=2851652 RepID=A0ABS6N9L8_9RHOB|nr:hypothetical protein [Thalassococcus arenae]MBV2360713.1 hypothetical protein [Thalassococcus arenae]